jgi:hypothetical protein
VTDLRTLAQAVVTLRGEIDALALEAKGLTGDNHKAATKRWWEMVRRLQKMNDDLRSDGLCVRILAALDAADAQGYARAMGEVVERADHSADYTGWSDYALGHRDAHERLAVWARERLPAAAERD